MKLAILKERHPDETRVAVTPEIISNYTELGCTVMIEAGAGLASSIPDSAFKAAGATIMRSASQMLKGADVILKLSFPAADKSGVAELSAMKKGAVFIALLGPVRDHQKIKNLARAGVSAFAMDLLPRITRAQAADVLSSQSNLAGYKAVIDAAATHGRAMPMMMTAAGTIPPAKLLVLGAGVAGLQAIATARRLGAVVSAFDVRPAAREHVESLGAKFIEVEGAKPSDAQTAGGYAREMGEAYKRKQAGLIASALAQTDIAISTALIPGKPAPILIHEDMVKSMKPGSIIVDLAVDAGGNCALSQPGKVVQKYGVTIIGYRNPPGRLAADASRLYARNLLAFLKPMMSPKGGLRIDWSDEMIVGTCLTRSGRIMHKDFSSSAKSRSARPARSRSTSSASKARTTTPKKPALKTRAKSRKSSVSKLKPKPGAKTRSKTGSQSRKPSSPSKTTSKASAS